MLYAKDVDWDKLTQTQMNETPCSGSRSCPRPEEVHTLWASGYELYDRLPKLVRGFMETLAVHCAQPAFTSTAARLKFKARRRTWPVRRGLPRACGPSTGSPPTSPEMVLRLVIENRELQVGCRSSGVNVLAIWDNRCVYHAAREAVAIEK
ncbi:hypothetical protein GGR54DRAFT_654047 [Hypoxylon sp. NC1633]|nr:hypothetical protein GGR54DRAFT_654047 [Hypoxylon sp. NC1633]